jgi:hypothetical protein
MSGGPDAESGHAPEPHEVTGVEYVPVCDQCYRPAEEVEELIDGQWRHVGFRHTGPAVTGRIEEAE